MPKGYTAKFYLCARLGINWRCTCAYLYYTLQLLNIMAKVKVWN